MLSRLMTIREQIVVGFLGLSIATGSAVLFWTQREGASPEAIVIEPALPASAAAPELPAPALAAPAPAPARQLVVSVQGAVITPGVYRLDEGSRVMDLIKAAGGVLGADTADINLAAQLIDGTTLTIPERVDPSEPSAESTPVNPAAYTISGQGTSAAPMPLHARGTPGGRINLNQASQAELETLPGIGPKLAQQIIQYREGGSFKSTDALMDVPGIGPQRFEAVRELITVE